jgi:hypothetical protein
MTIPLFVFYRAELKEGSFTQENVVLGDMQPIDGINTLVALEKFIAEKLNYKRVWIMNFQRMEEKLKCPKCGSEDEQHSHQHCIQGLPQPTTEKVSAL